jgi:hypothetical protein
VNPLAGARKTAGVDHRDEALQQFEIEHGTLSGLSIYKSTDA